MCPHSANRTTYLLEISHYSKKVFRIIYQKIEGPNFDFTEKHAYIFIWFLKFYCLKSFLSLDIILFTGNNFLNTENDRVIQNVAEVLKVNCDWNIIGQILGLKVAMVLYEESLTKSQNQLRLPVQAAPNQCKRC